MATTSATGLALWCHVIPLVSVYNEMAEGSQVSLSHYMTIDGNTKEKTKNNIPLVSSPDVGTHCCCVLEFDDVSAVPCLSLTMGPLKFSFFWQCLGGMIRDKWDVLANGVNETQVNFMAACDCLIAKLVCPTDLADQWHYLETGKKSCYLNCVALILRLETINKMMSLFPGANGNLPMQTVDIKNLYYQMMPLDWQHAFLNSGQVITNINYMLLDLQQFMTLQEEQNQAMIAWRRQH